MKQVKKLIIALLTMALLVGCSGGGDAFGSDEQQSYTVGILQFIQHDALDSATQGFKDALTDLLGDQVSFNEQNASGDIANCSMIANQFVSEQTDLIFANATPALQASSTATTDIPIVGTSVTSFKVALNIDDWNGTTGINVTGTSDLAPLDQQAKQIQEIFPEAKKVALFYCSAEPNSVFQADEMEKELSALGLESQRFTFSDSNDIAQVAITACDYADVVYIPTDNTAATYCSEDQFSKPVVAGEAGTCKNCGTVTVTITYYDIGYRAGEMAYEILVNGADPATMEVEEVTKTQKMYNASICEKYNIVLPDDYSAIE